ncbi:uncharacterized protein MELLADRAFT_113844 [Melampsora larici-populina 98AG31]|uniref:Uncharacterized protein n=1 Tax=Melampsora larici-populina (strain 98AG31 / pathotype 3-4-7) TaxID=747676 RepID=F4SB81_MELLP|nr:uncharacterized protein MELLADRAFT_113844 [Melampsora larici-populina 98AG31]EGF98112.1 hypothetical protein MELLADRAFT_113844 [Melampsora larici-populina 98AG31]
MASTNQEPAPEWMLPEFDPSLVEVSELKSILLQNQISHSYTQKSDLIQLFEREVRPLKAVQPSRSSDKLKEEDEAEEGFEIDYIIKQKFSPELGNEKEMKRKQKGKSKSKEPVSIKSEDSSSDDHEPLALRKKSVTKINSNQIISTARQTRQSTSSQRKRPRKSKPKPSKPEITSIKQSLEDLLQQNPHYDPTQDPLLNAQQAVNWQESRSVHFGSKESSIVIWASKTKSLDEFEILSLWYIFENQGIKRVQFGSPSKNFTSLKNSVPIETVKAHQVERILIHRNLTSEIGSLKELNKLVKLHNYVAIFEFGNNSNRSLNHEITRIQPIMTMNLILVPNYNCIMKNLTPTTNPFQIFRALQKENHHSQLFLHPITTKSLCDKYKSNKFKPSEKEAIEEVFKDLETNLVPIFKESLINSSFGVMKIEIEDQEDFTELDEMKGIVDGLNLLKQISYKEIRRFIMIVDDHSSWLNCFDHAKINLISSMFEVEVMSISEATERFASSCALL